MLIWSTGTDRYCSLIPFEGVSVVAMGVGGVQVLSAIAALLAEIYYYSFMFL
ncbi:hypothetical protein JOY44_06250 [Phormidium sp. CLA17]|uniref:hypothetical protein n=1 Tax=Leptolyngbya sp. Cla-17 TaxID=2803751 RepID=UPI001491409B|nr:hypothetical protein [Leptolyngbya sp. Cla-17]MBM0741222.1 hypothetical protein [Leptolyngbya sp. Cla-17]